MKKYIIMTVALLIINIQLIYSQSFQWAKGFGGNLSENSLSVYNNYNGNIYLTGNFSSSPAYFDTFLLNASGLCDIYIAKTDPNGNILWIRRAGSNASEVEAGIVIQKCGNNNIIVGGQFYNNASFDTININSFGSCDGFIAKYNDTGRCLWVKKMGGNNDDALYTACASSNIDILICGNFSSSIAYFDTINLIGGSLYKPKIFFAKYDTNGNCLWAKQSTGGNAWPMKIVSNNSKTFMTGYFTDSLTIGGNTLIENGNGDIFISAFDINGNFKWLIKAGGSGSNIANSICVDDSDNCYITGLFNDTATFGTQSIITNSTMGDMFIAKYDSSGNFKWVKQLITNHASEGKNIVSDGSNGFYTTGFFKGTAYFDSNPLTSFSTKDMFIAHYDNNGNCIGVRHAENSTGYGLCLDSNGSCIVTGTFTNSTYFDGNYIYSNGSTDIFLTKIDAITGVNQANKKADDKLIIYANPNTGKCNIIVPDDFLNETNLVLCIYDNTGKLIQKQNLVMEDDKISLSLEAEAKGIYTATLSNGKKVCTGRIVFE
jgi:hypothetical protein